MTNAADVRRRLEAARAELQRAEGEEAALKGQVDDGLKKLRELLGCKAGQERQALGKLREDLARDEAEVERLLDEAEAARDRKPEAEEPTEDPS